MKKVDFQVIWGFFDQKGPNGDENLKILWNRVHIRIQHRKVSINRYMMRHIEKVDFRDRKWLSVKIWPLKKFFFRQNRLFSLYFRELSDLEQKKNQKFFWPDPRFFWICQLIQHGKMPKISILRIFPDMRSFPEARGRLVLSFSTISEKSLDQIIFNSF